VTQWVQLAGVPSPSGEGSIRDSSELQAAFALFNRVSAELTDSYRLLERRVEELSTELEQVDRARLRELEEKERLSERLRSLLDLLPGGVVVLDRHGVVCDCNPAAREMLEGTLLGERWGEVIRRSFAPRRDDGHEISLKSGKRVSVATRSLDRDFGQVVLLTDQTETRELQDRLSRHQRLMAMGRMMAALAHQIRTPLSAATLYASHLSDENLSPGQTRRFAAKVCSRLEHMERQIRDMLIFVRGEVSLQDCVQVEELAAGIVSAMEAVLASSEASCELRIECEPRLSVRCNRDALTGAILNLVNNGLQAAGRRAALELLVSRCERWLHFSVID
jgi:two-component system sensor histidine kinase FlrB